MITLERWLNYTILIPQQSSNWPTRQPQRVLQLTDPFGGWILPTNRLWLVTLVITKNRLIFEPMQIFHFRFPEFLLGDDILVAPILDEGAVSRDIYLPVGTWRDEADPAHPTYVGPTLISSYPADLWTLPYFTRISGNSKPGYKKTTSGFHPPKSIRQWPYLYM